MVDLQLSSQVGPLPWNGSPMVAWNVSNASTGYDYDEWYAGQEHETQEGNVDEPNDPMDIDNADNYGWEGAGAQDRPRLDSVLADCLAIPV